MDNMIKVVLGFIELAFAFKFLSVADLAYGWRILDRETFLAIWIVIFGNQWDSTSLVKLNSHTTTKTQTAMPVPAIMLGMISLAFTVYMVPGLWVHL